MKYEHIADLSNVPYCYRRDYGGETCKKCGFKEECKDGSR